MPSITNLRCEGLTEPLGIGMPTPRLSWNISSEVRSARSVAWRLQVWEDSGEDVWDSGIVDGCASEVGYSGIPLKNRGCYSWRVKGWMSDGSETEWSDKANFECGFFDIEAWPGYWILYSANILNKENLTVNHLRGEFSLRQDKPLRRARAFVAGTARLGILGNDALRMSLYEVRLN